MNKVVVYWSGTGNTEALANKIASDLGLDALSVSNASVDKVLSNDLIIFGCPAMGAEELEEDEFKPFYEKIMSSIGNKKVALFGSYGWGDGEWMRLWEAEVGFNLLGKGLMVNEGIENLNEDEYEAFLALLR